MTLHPGDLPADAGGGQHGALSRCANGGSHRGLRTRIGPLNLLGSTTCPPWVISARPVATRRRAAIRAGSISSDQSSAPTARAASEGHTEALVDRPSSRDSREASSCRSTSLRPCLRQLSEHQRTESQSRAQTLRQVMVRPHRAHGLDGRGGRATPLVCPRERHTEQERTARRHPIHLGQSSPVHGPDALQRTEEVSSDSTRAPAADPVRPQTPKTPTDP